MFKLLLPLLISCVSAHTVSQPLSDAASQEGDNPAAPWYTLEKKNQSNPIYLWNPPAPDHDPVVVFKQTAQGQEPSVLKRVLDWAPAQRFERIGVDLEVGWRSALPKDELNFRVSLWSRTDERKLAEGSIQLSRHEALTDEFVPVDGDTSQPGVQPFHVELPFHAADPELDGDTLELRIERTNATAPIASDSWRSSAWIGSVEFQTKVAKEVIGQTEANLLARVVPKLAGRIGFVPLNGYTEDTFELTSIDDKPTIAGNNVNSRLAGLRWYLVHHLGMHFSRSADQINIPDKLPLPEGKPRTSPWAIRSANNPCVFGYSTPFWGWERWQDELDFLALNGVNQAYFLLGQAKIWQNVLHELNFPDTQIARWLPAFTHVPWWQMDNLQGYGGPPNQEEIDARAALAGRVARRMRKLGIEPVPFGFYGMVPDFFSDVFSDAHFLPQGNWAGGLPRPPVLDPTDPLFARVAALYYEQMEQVIGPVSTFGGDLFHEGGNAGNIDLAAAYRAVLDAMRAYRPDARWLLYGWNGNPRQEGLVTLPPDHVLVQQTSMNLGSAVPVSGHFRDYGGQIPWTWAMIDNFGGNHGLYGNMETLASLPSRFLNGGVPGHFAGLTDSPEAIGTNPLHTVLYYDMFWRSQDVDLSHWLDEAIPARYGSASPAARRAWKYLARSSYRCPIQQQGITDFIFATTPSANASHARTWGENTPYWCELDLVEAWEQLLRALVDDPQLAQNSNYRYDLIAVTRHVLNFHSLHVQRRMMAAFKARNSSQFEDQAEELLRLFDELDVLLGSDERWLFGRWIASARALGSDSEAQDRLERNARDLVTLWDGKTDQLDNYSSRTWAGLVGGLYRARWERYIEDLRDDWNQSGTPSWSGQDLNQEFLDDDSSYATQPVGKTTAIAYQLFRRLEAQLRQEASLRWSVPQQSTQPFVLGFELRDRLQAGTSYQISLRREFGQASAQLLSMSLRTEKRTLDIVEVNQALEDQPQKATLTLPSNLPSGPLYLDVKLQGPGQNALANGLIELKAMTDTSNTTDEERLVE